MLESGRISSKNEVNIMVKNAIDVVFGGLTYWTLGFGFSFGDYYPNSLIGIGKFFYDHDSVYESTEKSWTYSALLFQISYSTTTSTIVSGKLVISKKLKGKHQNFRPEAKLEEIKIKHFHFEKNFREGTKITFYHRTTFILVSPNHAT